MKRFIIILLVCLAGLASCGKEHDSSISVTRGNGAGGGSKGTEQTLFIYMPWSGNLTGYFRNNLEDLKKALNKDILRDKRIIVFFSDNQTEARLFEIKYESGKCVEYPIKEYSNPPFTTAEGITSILEDVIGYAPAERYAMVIGCHGMGWIPVQWNRTMSLPEPEYWEYEGSLPTRFFGGTTSEYQTDITTLAEGISGAGIKMEYIFFDDCYMSCIEVAYDLKDVTDHLIASPTEVMAYGMPYAEIGRFMVGNVDYGGITDGFLRFYQNYSLMPCGTIAVTVCGELDALASVMREINLKYTFDPALTGSVQVMDGYHPTRFFDLMSYVTALCPDPELLYKFERHLERAVPSRYRKHTEYFYTMSSGKIKIDTFSGTMTSDPSTSQSTSAKTETAWYHATH